MASPTCAIIVSDQDPAGCTVREQLLTHHPFKKNNRTFQGNLIFELNNFQLYSLRENQIFADFTNEISADFLIFASKHVSKAGVRSLTVHSLGNFGSADFGGKPFTVCPTSAALINQYLQSLFQLKIQKNLPYEITLEATHHGPYVTKPTVFIELGSTEEHWTDPVGAQTIAETIINHSYSKNLPTPIAIGFGGTHYCNAFNKLALSNTFAFSYICPKHYLANLTPDLIQQMLDKSREKVSAFVLDYKGLGAHKPFLLNLLKDFDVEIVRK